jgi:hypothetical protein
MEERLAEIVSPVHGTVTRIESGVGDRVQPGRAVATVESAEMRLAVEADVVGTVHEVRAVVGEFIEPGTPLVVVDVGPGGLLSADVDGEPADHVVDTSPSPTRCTHCGAEELELGFIEDRGQHSGGYGRWVQGSLELGVFGGARRMGRQRRPIEAYRCSRCSHLELFASDH